MKKSCRSLVALVCAVLLASMLGGCASLSAMPNEDEVSSLKGQTKKAVEAKYGKPEGKTTDSHGNQVWTYKRPAANQQGSNTLWKIGSFGIFSGTNSAYVDIWKITFNSKGKVSSALMEENVTNISLPGSSSAKKD